MGYILPHHTPLCLKKLGMHTIGLGAFVGCIPFNASQISPRVKGFSKFVTSSCVSCGILTF